MFYITREGGGGSFVPDLRQRMSYAERYRLHLILSYLLLDSSE